MQRLEHARDLYDGPVMDDEEVGACDDCDSPILGQQPVSFERFDDVVDGVHVRTVRLRCDDCARSRLR